MSTNNHNLEANSFYSVDDPTSLMETKLSFLKKAIEEHNIVSEMGAGRFPFRAILAHIERKLEWCCRGSGVDEKNMYDTIPWKHVVRLSMQRLKKQGIVENSGRGYWNILE